MAVLNPPGSHFTLVPVNLAQNSQNWGNQGSNKVVGSCCQPYKNMLCGEGRERGLIALINEQKLCKLIDAKEISTFLKLWWISLAMLSIFSSLSGWTSSSRHISFHQNKHQFWHVHKHHASKPFSSCPLGVSQGPGLLEEGKFRIVGEQYKNQ